MKLRKTNNYKQSDKECRDCKVGMLEISHKEIKPSHLKQPYYYSKWYKCEKCGKNFNFEEDKVWNHNEMSEWVKNEEETERQLSFLSNL